MAYPNAARRNRRTRGQFTPSIPWTSPAGVLTYVSGVTSSGVTLLSFSCPHPLAVPAGYLPNFPLAGVQPTDCVSEHGEDGLWSLELTYTPSTATGPTSLNWPTDYGVRTTSGGFLAAYQGTVTITT